MVRQATETAVSASISTPVWPATFTSAVTRMPGGIARGLEVDGRLGDGERMAERDQLVGLLGGHDAGDAGGGQHVALLGLALLDQRQRRRRHGDEAFGARGALGGGLVGDVDHARLALVVEVRELGHGAIAGLPCEG